MPNSSKGSSPKKPDLAGIRFIEVTRETRSRFEDLFEQPGAPKYCWCMAWRHSSREHIQNDEKKKMMLTLIDGGTPIGIVAELGGNLVGWCSVAPRETYRRLWKDQDDGEEDVWSIACFYVPRALRGGGLASALLDAAMEHAFAKGAKIVEAYPVDEAAPSYRFMGFRDMFVARGFHEVGTAGTRRHVMRLDR